VTAIPPLGVNPRENKTYVPINTYRQILLAALIMKQSKTGKNPNIHEMMNGQANCSTSTIMNSSIKRNKPLIHPTTTWMKLKVFPLC